MGNYNITIRGVGQHHNVSAPPATRARDAEVMAAKFVAELQAAGHSITLAYVTTGGEADVLSSPDLVRAATPNAPTAPSDG